MTDNAKPILSWSTISLEFDDCKWQLRMAEYGNDKILFSLFYGDKETATHDTLVDKKALAKSLALLGVTNQ